MNPYQWGYSWAPSLAALPFFPFNVPTANGGGRWERWHYGADTTVMNGSSIEPEFLPNSFSIKINGNALVAGNESTNPPDPWSSALCAALVSDAKQGITARDNNSAGIHINSGIHGGAYTTGPRSNLTITSVLPSNTIITHGHDNSS